MKAKILITGGTGMIGSALSQLLAQEGFEVIWLSRSEAGGNQFKTFKWSIRDQYIDPEALQVDYIVHLAGAGIADQRWSAKRKKIIYDSRIESTRLLHRGLTESGHKPQGLISSSAIGYYGADTGEATVDENSSAGSDFVAKVVVDWEKEADKIGELGVQVAKIRTGIVLSEKGGALPKLTQPIRFGAGAPIGSGKQYMSWIHINDLCRIFHFIISDQKWETFNGVAPNPVTNEELTEIAAKALGRPLFLPNVPSFVLQLVFGEMSSIILGGNRVSAQKIEKVGYQFLFESAESAVRDLIG